MRRLRARRRALILTALLLGCVFRVDRSVAPGQLIGTALSAPVKGKQLPAVGATVVLEQSPLSTTTDKNGNFQFNGLPAGTYTVRITQGEGSSGMGIRTAVTIGPNNGYDLGKFSLSAFGSIVGTATVNGNAAGSGTIAAIAGLSELRLAGGMYSFPNLPPGSYQVTVMSTDFVGVLTSAPSTVQVVSSQAAEAAPATLSDQSSIATTGAVQGLVQIGGASSNGGATVQFSGTGPSLTTSESGGFTSGGVSPGLYTATFSLSGFQTVTVADIIVGAGTTVVPPVTLLPGKAESDAGITSCFADTECSAVASCIRGSCRVGAVGASCTLGSNATCQAGPSPVCLTAAQVQYCSSSCNTDSDCGSGAVCVTNLQPPLPVGDAGIPDGGDDAGLSDGGSPDAGANDAGAMDAGSLDAGAPDAGGLDGGPPDGGDLDAGGVTLDAGSATTDAGVSADAGSTSVDAGAVSTDAGGATADGGGGGVSGFCVGTCTTNTDCASTGVCDTWQDESGTAVQGCWVACLSNSDCGPGETCDSASGACL